MKVFTTLSLLALTISGLHAESLASKLEDRAKQSAKKHPENIRTEFAKGIQAVDESGVVNKAKKTGNKAPDFTVKDSAGAEVKLSELLKSGPVVLTWYRGGWCPYCNIALTALQEELPKIKAAGAQLVALTPELPDKTLSTKEKNQLDFVVGTDLNHQIADDYGLIFELTPEVEKIYGQFFDLKEFNGEEAGSKRLPLAATYIIDTDGTIQWHFLHADYRKRAEPSEIVTFLEGMK